MSSEQRYEIHAGIFLLVTLLLFVLSIYFLGRDRQIFERQVEFFTEFKDIKGLNEGAPVRLGGISVGRVARIEFGSDEVASKVRVAVLVNETVAPRIRIDAVASIDTQGLLGDRFISLVGGSAPAVLAAGSKIKSKTTSDVGQALARAGSLVDSSAEIAERINSLLTKFEGKPMNDLETALSGIAALLQEIQDGKGVLHRLVYSKKDGDSLMGSLETTASDVADIVRQIKSGEGLISALIYGKNGPETVQALGDAARALAITAQEISAVATEIKDGNGLAHQLLYADSPDGVDDIVASLSRSAANLEQVSKSLAEGSGTLGALLIDSKLYDNVVEITDDAKRSYILRRAIRKSLEAGADGESEDAEEPGTAELGTAELETADEEQATQDTLALSR